MRYDQASLLGQYFSALVDRLGLCVVSVLRLPNRAVHHPPQKQVPVWGRFFGLALQIKNSGLPNYQLLDAGVEVPLRDASVSLPHDGVDQYLAAVHIQQTALPGFP